MLKYIFSGFADEISPNLDEQIATLKELNINYLELRSVDKINIADFTIDFAKEVKAKLNTNGIKVSSLGSPIGKINITDDFGEHFEKYKHVVELAKIFETKYIRIFSFYIDKDANPYDYTEEVMKRLAKFIEYAKEKDIILLHENEKGIYGDIDVRCKEIFEKLYCSNFRCTFDPANFVQCSCNTLESFDMLSDYIEYMHIKDAKSDDGLVVPPGKGNGNIKGLMEKLSVKNYTGFLSFEPHLKEFAGLEALENGENLSVDSKMKELKGSDTFKIAHSALCEILATVE